MSPAEGAVEFDDRRCRLLRLAGTCCARLSSTSSLCPEAQVSIRYHAVMGMTLRTSAEQTEALRRQAIAEGRSMQAVALSAIDEYIARRTHKAKVAAALQRVVREEAGVLRRLKDA